MNVPPPTTKPEPVNSRPVNTNYCSEAGNREVEVAKKDSGAHIAPHTEQLVEEPLNNRSIEVAESSQGKTEIEELFDKGMDLIKEDRFEEGITIFNELVKVAPGKREHHSYLGLCLFRAQRYGEAEVSIQNALRLEPGNLWDTHLMGVVLLLLERPTEAEEYSRKAVKGDSENILFLGGLYAVLCKQDRRVEANSLIKTMHLIILQGGTQKDKFKNSYRGSAYDLKN